MIKKILLVHIIFVSILFAMPNIIQDYEQLTIPTPSASKMKDSISPTKDILSKADEIYTNEQNDLEAILKIEKYRIRNSKYQTFLVKKEISLADILFSITNLNKMTNNKPIIEKRENNDKE